MRMSKQKVAVVVTWGRRQGKQEWEAAFVLRDVVLVTQGGWGPGTPLQLPNKGPFSSCF